MHAGCGCSPAPQTKASSQAGSKRRRKQKKAESMQDGAPYDKRHGPEYFRRVPGSVTVCPFDGFEVKYAVARGGFIGKRLDPKRKTPWTVKELLDAGYEEVKWDGGHTLLFIDGAGNVFAAFLGLPVEDDTHNGPSFIQSGGLALDAMIAEHENAQGCFTTVQRDHRRGTFTALSVGVSYGGGQQAPRNLAFK
ncbi:hypothetical protein K488DRAFT_92803, partial [Vararia minispora EC-137]